MINEKSITAVDKAIFSKQFCRPIYDSYCFSNIPGTVQTLLGQENLASLPSDTYEKKIYDHVVLLFLDGFGWTFFEKYKKSIEGLNKLEATGIVSKLTSMFPSTTAAHVTCMNTGLVPGESGIYEWFIYDPKLDEIIAPLPFCLAGERKGDTLPLSAKEAFPFSTLYQALATGGIHSRVVFPQTIANSSYSNCLLSGATVYSYRTLQEAKAHLLAKPSGKSYTYFYYSDIDSIGHRKGIRCKEFKEAIARIFEMIETLLENLPDKTALLITADHGMVDVDPKTTYYLNREIPNITKYVQFNHRKRPLVPAGSCRDFFLHADENRIDEFQEVLGHFLKEKAEVHLTADLIERQFFGPLPLKQRFLARVGNLVVLPYKGEGVWWYEKGHFEQNFYAAHGGLTREEMEIPFIFCS